MYTFTFADFKKALEEQINASCNVLEESIVQTYERHSKTIQDKLQELFAVLERISMASLYFGVEIIDWYVNMSLVTSHDLYKSVAGLL